MMAAITVLFWMIFRLVVPLVLFLGIGTWLERKQHVN
jgi:hypothetical protein